MSLELLFYKCVNDRKKTLDDYVICIEDVELFLAEFYSVPNTCYNEMIQIRDT